MLSNFKAIIYLEYKFFLNLFIMSLLPFLLISFYLPKIPNMHYFFIGLLALIRFMLPEQDERIRYKTKRYLDKKNRFSHKNLITLTKATLFYRDLFYIILAMIIFLIGIQ